MFIKLTTVTLPLLIGSLIYIGWRPLNLTMFSWFEEVGILESILYIRATLSMFNIPDWVIYCLPNGTWTFSFTAVMSFLWLQSDSQMKYFWIFTPIALGYLIELGQYYNILVGTFCYGDLIAHTIGAFLALFLVKNFRSYSKLN